MNEQNSVTRTEANESVQRILIRWIFSATLVAFIAWVTQALGFEFYESWLYRFLSALTPGMKLLPSFAKNETVAAGLWVYITYSVPVVVCIALRSVTHCRLSPELWRSLLTLAIFVALAIAAFEAIVFGKLLTADSNSSYALMYKNTLVGTMCVPIILGAATITAIFFPVVYVRELWYRATRSI